MYRGDIRLGDTIDFKFCTVQSTGAPITLAGTPSLSAYPGNSTTQITAGITLSVDFDGVTGLHNVRIVASGGNGYLTATNYEVTIAAGTINGVSAVGYVVGAFSIENRSALMPTTAARTADVSAGGEVGVDWANVGSPTTALALTGTTIAVTQKVDVDTIKTNPVVNGGTITFPTTATLASTTNITAGTIATVTNLTNAPTAGDLTATMKTSVTTAATAATPTAAAVTGAVGSVTGAVGSVTGAVGSVTGSVGSIATAGISAASFAAGAIDAAAIAADAIGSSELAASAATEIATAVSALACTEPTNAPAASPTLIQALSWQHTLSRNKITQTATDQVLKADDGTTTIAQAPVSDDGTVATRGEFV